MRMAKKRRKKRAGAKPKSGKKASSGAKAVKKKEEKVKWLTTGRIRKIYGVVFLALGVFTFLCVFATGSVGILGKGVSKGLSWALGIGRFAVPFIFLVGSLLSFSRKPEVPGALVAIGLAVMALSVLAMFHIHIPTDEMFATQILSDGGGGGLLGAVVAWPSVKLIGQVGAYIFTSALFLVGLILAFEEKLSSTYKRFKREPEARPRVEGEPLKSAEVNPPSSAASEKVTSSRVYPSEPVPNAGIDEEPGGQLAIKVQPTKGRKYKVPPLSILNRAKDKAFSQKSNEERKRAIENTLHSMDVDAKVSKVSKGPTVSLFEVEVGTGEKVRRVTELEQDIAYALGSPDIRIYSPIPGKRAIGIEVPNNIRDNVLLGDIIDKLGPTAPHNLLTMAVGKDMSGEAVILDLAQLPHLLLAGSTGAGKSCCINSMVSCLLLRGTPDEVRFIMIDPKFVEFTFYEGLPHLLCEVINEPEPAARALQWAVSEMENRYQRLQKQRVVHIDDYNAVAEKDEDLEPMPKIVIVIDELGDLMIVARREVENSISRLTAKARAVGIHMIIATQRPSVDVITGVIKNNITARVAFQVASNADSRTILGTKGAEKLLGKGDMLLDPGNIPQPIRVQGALIQHKEIELLTGYIKEQKFKRSGTIDLDEESASAIDELKSRDSLLDDGAEFVVYAGEASASMLQTHLRVGYARARRILIELEELGIVGPHEGSKSRKVLLTPEEFEEWKSRQG